MKKIGFLNFGHWTPSPSSKVRTGADSLLQSIELAVAAEELGADGAYFRVHHSLDSWRHRSPYSQPNDALEWRRNLRVGRARPGNLCPWRDQ
jgi:alkanesulfonate monooxygenase SsuD/methylene tetrahydromethanopterin reductase-like flavin-dependent oxidoreductase (luciferase family)